MLITCSLCACPQASPQRNVLLITVDTLRADFVHAYGFEPANTPSLDALAERGALFENAIAAATVTAPAHASIMTARYAREHSVGTRNGDTRLEGMVTLAELFENAGYDTAAFVSNVVLRRRLGLDRGFQTYDDDLVRGESNRQSHFERIAESTALRAIDWLEKRAGRGFFLWVHLQDPHGPYAPPQSFAGKVGDVALRSERPLPVLETSVGRAGIPDYQALADLRTPAAYAGRYAEEIMYADHWIGKLVEAADRQSGDRGTVALVTGDHGESMGEAGWFFQHGHSTTPDLARVPFILVAPGVERRRYETVVSHVDVAPTLLELAGLPALEQSSGISLARLVKSHDAPADRLVFCDTKGEAAAYHALGFARVGVSSARAPAGAGLPMQFEAQRKNERGEWRPAEIDERTKQRLVRYIASRVPLVAAGVMEPEHIEQLRALGYIPQSDDAAGQQAAPDGDPAQ